MATQAASNQHNSPHPAFVCLCPNVFLHEPTTTKTDRSLQPPTLVVCTWMGATPRNIRKYIDGYMTACPTTRILLLTCNIGHIFLPTFLQGHHTMYDSALDVLFSTASEDSTISIHAAVYSNGGCLSLCELADAHRRKTGRPLTVSSLLIDSAPGLGDHVSARKALSVTISSQVGSNIVLRGLVNLVVFSFVSGIFAYLWLTGGTDPITQIRRNMNDPTLFVTTGRRTYVYGDRDVTVASHAVESSAEEAKSRGWSVEMERFEGSSHVRHAVTNGERYWGIVKRVLDTKV